MLDYIKEHWKIIGIIALIIIWNAWKILKLVYGSDEVDTYWSDGSHYHVGDCFFINGENVDADYPSMQEAEEDGLEPCWLCIHH